MCFVYFLDSTCTVQQPDVFFQVQLQKLLFLLCHNMTSGSLARWHLQHLNTFIALNDAIFVLLIQSVNSPVVNYAND